MLTILMLQEDRSVLAFFDALVNEEERGLDSLCDSSSDDSDVPSSLLMDPDSDDSFSDITFPMFGDGPVDFMRYPYPDEEPGRATWDFMTPQERWDWHHGRREWYYADGEDASTPSESGNSSSFEAPWSEDSDIERRDDDAREATRENASLSVAEDKEGVKREHKEQGKGVVTENGPSSSSAHPSNSETERQTQKDAHEMPQNKESSDSCESAQPGDCKCCREKFRITIGDETKRKSKRTSEPESPFRILYIGGGSHQKETADHESQQPSTSKETQAVNGSAPDVVTTPFCHTKKACGDGEQGDGDLFKSIPPVQFYSSRQTSSASLPPHAGAQNPSDSNNSIRKRLCSQGQENVPSTSSGCESMLTEPQRDEGAAGSASGCQYASSATI